jgi:hypothetical protein
MLSLFTNTGSDRPSAQKYRVIITTAMVGCFYGTGEPETGSPPPASALLLSFAVYVPAC